MEDRFVYADNAATTPIHADVLNKMMPFLTTEYGNASTLYRLGQSSHKALENARQEVALLMNAEPAEITFTGCGSESDNLALRGYLHSRQAKGRKHLIISTIEHHAILYTAQALEKEGFEVTYLPVNQYGQVEPQALEQAIRPPDTALVSIMFANNEIGTINPVAELGRVCHEKGVVFHTDAVQAYGHVPIDVKAMNIDMLSLSGHKINAPKGVGAIYVRKGIRLEPQLTGGGQERGLRSGTENIASIVGLGEAARLKRVNMERETAYIGALSRKLIDGVLQLPQTILTGHPTQRLPGTCSFCINAIEGESLVLRLDMNGICASTGSACSTGSLDPSHVLLGIGLSHEISHGSLRLTLGPQNTEEDVDYILERLKGVVETLRAMSPIWDPKQN